ILQTASDDPTLQRQPPAARIPRSRCWLTTCFGCHLARYSRGVARPLRYLQDFCRPRRLIRPPRSLGPAEFGRPRENGPMAAAFARLYNRLLKREPYSRAGGKPSQCCSDAIRAPSCRPCLDSATSPAVPRRPAISPAVPSGGALVVGAIRRLLD